MNITALRYWIIVASKDHAKSGMAAGIAQACHGKSSPLKRMKKGDERYLLLWQTNNG